MNEQEQQEKVRVMKEVVEEEGEEKKRMMEEGDVDGQKQPDDVGLSKKALKRKANCERWLEKRKVKRAEEKQKKKEKRAAIKAAGLGESLKRAKPNKMADSTCKLRLVVDMGFDDLMVERDRRRCIAQLAFCYSANRKEQQPAQFHIVHFDGPSREMFDGNGTYTNWDVHIHREALEEIVHPPDIVYLTADSDNVLTDLDESKAYIIGGLVDHNAHKGVCLARAELKGWQHAKLPINEFIKLQSRRVLTVNHVYEILLRYWTTKDWERAFFDVIPKRKGAEKKDEEGEEEEGESEGEEQETTEVTEHAGIDEYL